MTKRKYAPSKIIAVRFHLTEIATLNILRGKVPLSVYIRKKALGSDWVEEEDKIGYNGIHAWIRRKFGKASTCDNKDHFLGFPCVNKYKKYEWAKKRGSTYTKEREDYYQLCINCHRRYDRKSENLTKI